MRRTVKSERVYPKGKVATVVVWLLDRLPKDTRKEVLDSYWSFSDILRVKAAEDRFKDLFRSTPEEDQEWRRLIAIGLKVPLKYVDLSPDDLSDAPGPPLGGSDKIS